jgi:hypothetical protein
MDLSAVTEKIPDLSTVTEKLPSIPNLNNSTLIETLKSNIKQYKKLIGLLATIFIFIIISYFISENYRIKLVLDDMNVYDSTMVVTNSDFSDKNKEQYKLSDYYVASSFRSVIGKNQLLDYCSTRMLQKTLKNGARFIWLDVFNSDLSETPFPVVGNGFKEGNWNLCLNTLSFDKCCKVIANYAFTSGKVNNPKDPLILGLNLNTQNNLHSLKKMKDSIMKHLGHKLMDVHYGYNKVNFGEVLMKKIKSKLLIFTSEGFEGSDLEELVNYSWDNKNMKQLVYKSIDPNVKVTEYIKENLDSLRQFNSTNLTIVTPDPTTLFTRQYEPKYAWNNGCQFVSMYYQKVDKFMEQNVDKFKNNSFVLKPKNLRKSDFKSKSRAKSRAKLLGMNSSNSEQKEQSFSKCPILPN